MSDSLLNITEVDQAVNYWFIRTESGNNFDPYYENDFIGIGWNQISFKELIERPQLEIKAKIARTEEIDQNSVKGKRRITDIYNKLIRFTELKRDDIVVIPSESSNHLAFGRIADDEGYTANAGEDGCSQKKRREVQWLTEPKRFATLDPIFYQIRKSRHSISNVNDYSYYIDSILYDVYKKGNNSHFVIKVKTNAEINFLKLADVLIGLNTLMKAINEEFQLGENVDATSIRINVQSPGLLNLRQMGEALLLVACLLGAPSCRQTPQPPATQQGLTRVGQGYQDTINKLNNDMRDLDMGF